MHGKRRLPTSEAGHRPRKTRPWVSLTTQDDRPAGGGYVQLESDSDALGKLAQAACVFLPPGRPESWSIFEIGKPWTPYRPSKSGSAVGISHQRVATSWCFFIPEHRRTGSTGQTEASEEAAGMEEASVERPLDRGETEPSPDPTRAQ